MRFLVDAQLPPGLASFLADRGHEAKPVRDLNLREATDDAIWRFAIEGSWIVVTKDEDFAQRTFNELGGPQVVWLRIGNCVNRVLLGWFEPQLPAVISALEAGHRLIEVKR